MTSRNVDDDAGHGTASHRATPGDQLDELLTCLRFLWEKSPTDSFQDFGSRIRKALGEDQ